ncbi:MAG: PLP-dependent lyase/thiolase [Patescibacteria group bacterium]|nr:PLP-dependent lyase/thiolase [Patescibacteria group bacterium]
MLTPQFKTPRLAKIIGLKNELYLKREDLHPYGSHKGRSIPLMIEKYAKEKLRDFVVSSSGNAALASALYISEYNKRHPQKSLTLKIFVGKNIEKEKMKNLKRTIRGKKFIILSQTANPKQSAFQMEKNNLAKNLRQSTDDSALIGYKKLAAELSKIKNLSAVFIPTSSGATAQAIYLSFKKIGINPQIHIVQTTACHPIADEINKDEEQTIENTKKSLASAIVDKIAHRKKEVSEAVKKSNGDGWIINDQEIKTAIKITEKTTGIKISPNSALSMAGLSQAVKQGRQFSGSVVCLLTGK